jgi:uncharacterized protein GlcG (DUF336 family)
MSGRKVVSMSELHESAVRQSHMMTLADATEIARRCLDEASRLGTPSVVAVVDVSDSLIFLARQDGAVG